MSDTVPAVEHASRRARRRRRRREHERGAGRRDRARALPPGRRARLLLPEGGERPARHAARRASRRARVFALDTHVLFPETYARLARGRAALRHHGRGASRARRSAARPRRTATSSGSATRRSAARSARSSRSGARSPASTPGSPACAATSRRRARTRRKLGWDERHELWKVNPLADWTDDDVWALHPRARPPRTTRCTTAATRRSAARTAPLPGAGREGRWAGSDKTECGLHA